ncbi:hypothetical protein [Ensifer adhaerens]|jgi:hypothetical protein|uniref:hypothetical protein n=1 Tax=Ensifer adhaerens TaxID=106592 RepID=UPI002030CE6D|nr:hypothetical protein [Ensifer adhaerens]
MSAEGQTIPDDIMKAAEVALDNLLCNCRESCGSTEAARQASIKDIAASIFDERKRCASVARDATMMTGAPIQEMGDEVAAAVLSQPKAVKFWMVYGVGQRGSTYQHRSKASAQEEAKRLASQHPGIAFVVLAAVDAYFVDVPVMQRIKITKPDPAAYERDRDDSIPF